MKSKQQGGYIYDKVRHHRSTALARGIKIGKSKKKSALKKKSKKQLRKKTQKMRRKNLRKKYTKRR